MKKTTLPYTSLSLLSLIALTIITLLTACARESKTYDRSYRQPAPAQQQPYYTPPPRDPKAL
ncbi:MAG: hypothetical protein NZM04_04550 [Methylacidiphilales bacterium]|nr:hypothetical protein [Candidatus Methylacidiphilales bacterium]MDW8350101.1 hypothetical protein [Verrucomicrobiae bacterium]